MIAYVTGEVLSKTVDSAVVLTRSGVGYEIFLTQTGALQCPNPGGEAAFHVQTVVREDSITLFGFQTPQQRHLFQVLTGIPKLGPKKALAILSMYDPEVLFQIAAREDVVAMSKVPGIGKKTGQQIVWDLKHKLKDQLAAPTAPSSAGAPADSCAASQFMDALGGLCGLGYSEEEVRPLVVRAFDEEPDLDAASAIRLVLKEMSGASK